MLVLDIPERELFDESTDRFIKIKAQTLKLEHSLISISKWESRWLKPFLTKERKTKEELLDYIKCMITSPVQDTDIVQYLSADELNKIIEYIDSPMTATTVTFFGDKKPKTKAGVYIIDSRRIRVYAKWQCSMSLEEIAIHEYAHHIHETEKRTTQNRRKERTNGPEFWRIFSALCCKAIQKGLYTDEFIADLIN